MRIFFLDVFLYFLTFFLTLSLSVVYLLSSLLVLHHSSSLSLLLSFVLFFLFYSSSLLATIPCYFSFSLTLLKSCATTCSILLSLTAFHSSPLQLIPSHNLPKHSALPTFSFLTLSPPLPLSFFLYLYVYVYLSLTLFSFSSLIFLILLFFLFLSHYFLLLCYALSSFFVFSFPPFLFFTLLFLFPFVPFSSFFFLPSPPSLSLSYTHIYKRFTFFSYHSPLFVKTHDQSFFFYLFLLFCIALLNSFTFSRSFFCHVFLYFIASFFSLSFPYSYYIMKLFTPDFIKILNWFIGNETIQGYFNYIIQKLLDLIVNRNLEGISQRSHIFKNDLLVISSKT